MGNAKTLKVASAATRAVAIVLLPIMLFSPAEAAQPSKAVRAALANIRSVAGMSVLERMKSCGITFADGSWVATMAQDNADFRAHKGDMMLEVYIDIPSLPDQDAVAYTDLLARWVISHGVARPVSAWAESLQNKQVPIGSMVWMNC